MYFFLFGHGFSHQCTYLLHCHSFYLLLIQVDLTSTKLTVTKEPSLQLLTVLGPQIWFGNTPYTSPVSPLLHPPLVSHLGCLQSKAPLQISTFSTLPMLSSKIRATPRRGKFFCVLCGIFLYSSELTYSTQKCGMNLSTQTIWWV